MDEDPPVVKFNKEMRALLGKYKFVLSAVPFIDADGRTMARPIILEADKKETVLDV